MTGYKENFGICEHNWKIHIQASECSGPAAGNTMFLCDKCKTEITMSEKCSLESTKAQKESLKIQESRTKISMQANIISAITLVIAVLGFLFGR